MVSMEDVVDMGVLRWSEIETEEERQQFANFFIQSDVKFTRMRNGMYEAIVRMVPPGIDREVRVCLQPSSWRARGPLFFSWLVHLRLCMFVLRAAHPLLPSPFPPHPTPRALHAQSAEQRRTVAADSRPSGQVRSYGFPKFESFLDPPAAGSQNNSERPLSWLMRVMEDIYDARFTHDSAEFVQNVDDDASAAPDRPGRMSDIFPVFCYDYFSKKYGLKPLVERNAHELLRCVEAKRGDHLEVQIFARFLEEYYDADDILFFLYVRSIIMKESGINFRIRWSEGAGRSPRESLWLSYRACQLVSRTVFMSERDPLYIAFMRTVDEHLIGSLTQKEDTRRIEVATFLQLALQEYHECRPVAGDAPLPAAAPSKEQARLFRDAEQDYARAQAEADRVRRQNEQREQEAKQQQRAAYDAASRPLPAAPSRGAPNISPGGNAGKPKVHVSRHGSISINMGGGGAGHGGGRPMARTFAQWRRA
jgi:hypothetical protein